MKIKVIVVGKTKENYLQIGEQDYRKRITRYCELEWIVVKQDKLTQNKSDELYKTLEGERIIKKLEPGEWIIALDQNGSLISSENFAAFILDKMNTSIKTITFIIGGPLGLSKDVLQRSNTILSLSRMTFTHEMSRLILLEQIYRAFTIIKGEKYHK